MLKFGSYLEEAYDFFPTSEQELSSRLDKEGFSSDVKDDYLKLFNFLKSKDDSPINLDLKKKNSCNVTRRLQGSYSIADIKKETGVKLSLKFGNGSSGNRGANNRGNAFETEFANAIEKWYENGEEGIDAKLLETIKGLDELYGISKSKKFDAVVVGGENTKRPLVYRGRRILISNPKGKGLDVGPNVTDITLMIDGKPVYLSLKFSSTVTFFNSGIAKVITKEEIDSGEIKNPRGVQLLKLFGIDNKRFCSVFSPDIPTKGGVANAKPDRGALISLLASGIGYGYHIIHKKGKNILSKKMDRDTMKKAATVGPVKIYYGGKGGNGKRIDIEMESDYYIFKVNIRDSQGKSGYPNRIMCDFKDK